MRRLLFLALAVLGAANAQAEYLTNYRYKNAATRVRFEGINVTNGDLTTGVTWTLTCGCAAEEAGITLAACNGGTTGAEIATNSGVYEITVNAADTNGDHCLIKAVSGTANVEDTVIEIVTRFEAATIQLNNAAGTALSVVSAGGNGHGAYFVGQGSGAGIYGYGGATSGHGLQLNSQGGNGTGLLAQGAGTGSGAWLVPGATGPALKLQGGATSGAAIAATTTTGDAVTIAPGGGNGDAVQCTPHGTGVGFQGCTFGTTVQSGFWDYQRRD
jgi:hypothetical protein